MSGSSGSGTTVYWTNWTSDIVGATNGSAGGTIATSTGTITISYSGEVTSETNVSGTSTSGYPSWTPASSYSDGTVVPDAPTYRDIIALNGGPDTGLNTITFSQPIVNPVMAIWSLGSPSDDANFTFGTNEPYTILSGGPSAEYGGGGLVPNGSINSVTGSEGNGTIQFIGTYSQLTFTNSVFENYYGFTIGAEGSALSATVDTISGGAGLTLALDFGSATLAALAAPLLANVTSSNGLVATVGGAYTMADGQSAAVDATPEAVTVTGNGAANQTILAGAGPFTFIAGQGGGGSVVAGGGNDFINLAAGGNWLAALGAGADTIIGTTGSATVNAGGAALYFGNGGATLFNAFGATATLVGGGAETINAGAASMLVFGGPGALAFNAGSGASTVISGAGGATVTGGSTGTLYFGTGPTSYVAGTAVDTVLGFTGTLTATGGANGTLFFTGTGGANNVSTGAGSSTIIGFGTGDTLTATGSGTDIIAASGASETINGATSTGTNTYFAFGANDSVIGGAGTTAIESGLGNHTLVAGSGTTLFEILAGTLNRAITIGNFVSGQDFVQLQGYAAGAGAAALQTAATAGGSEVLTLSDGTKLTFQGVTGLEAGSFV